MHSSYSRSSSGEPLPHSTAVEVAKMMNRRGLREPVSRRQRTWENILYWASEALWFIPWQ